MNDQPIETETNKPTINWVTRTICVLAIIFGVTMCALAWVSKDIPDQLNMLAGIVIGGLLSMLTKSTPTPAQPPTQQIKKDEETK